MRSAMQRDGSVQAEVCYDNLRQGLHLRVREQRACSVRPHSSTKHVGSFTGRLRRRALGHRDAANPLNDYDRGELPLQKFTNATKKTCYSSLAYDKGRPAARRGRKATDLLIRDSRATEGGQALYAVS
jgi:hypothetical protein